eukprot:gene623-8127_t
MKLKIEDTVVDVLVIDAVTGKEIISEQIQDVSTVKSLTKIVSQILQIKDTEIVLLSKGEGLYSSESLSKYGNLSEIFVFTTVHKQEYLEDEFEEPPKMEYPELLKENTHLLVNTGRLFYKHYFEGTKIKKTYNNVVKLNRQIKNQKKGFDMLNENLKNHANVIHSNYEKFQNEYTRKNQSFQKLIDEFDKDIERLKTTELHPLFQEENKKHLIDFFDDIEKIKAWKLKCDTDLKSFNKKVAKGEDVYMITKDHEILSKTSFTGVDFEEIATKTSNLKKMLEKIEFLSVLQVLKKDYEDIKTIIEQPFDSQSTFVAYSDKEEIQKEFLKNLKKFELDCIDTLNLLSEFRKKSIPFLITAISQVSDYQKELGKLRKRILTVNGHIGSLERRFDYLQNIHLMPDAYYLTLIDVSRRNNYNSEFKLKIQDLNEYLNTVRTKELKNRQTFNTNVGKYLPPMFKKGLTEEPIRFKIDVENLKSELPAYDLKDLEIIEAIHSKFYKKEEIDELMEDENEKLNDTSKYDFTISASQDDSEDLPIEKIRKNLYEEFEKLKDYYQLKMKENIELEEENEKLKLELKSKINHGSKIEESEKDDEIQKMKKEMEEMKKLLIEKDVIVTNLTKENSKHQKELTKKNQENSRLSEMLDQNQIDIKSLNEKIQEKDQKIESLNEKLDNSSSMLQSQNESEKLNQLNLLLDDQNNSLAEYENKVLELETKLKQSKDNSVSSTELKQKNAQIDELKKINQEKTENVEELRETIKKLEETNQLIQTHLDTLMAETQSSRVEEQEVIKKTSEEIASLTAQIKSLQSELMSTKSDLQLASSTKDNLTQSHASKSDEVDRANQKNIELQESINDLTAQFSETSVLLEKERKEMFSLRKQLDELSSINQYNNSQNIEKLKSQIIDLETKKKSVENCCAENIKAVEALETICELSIETLISISNFLDDTSIFKELQQIKNERNYLKLDKNLLAKLLTVTSSKIFGGSVRDGNW